MTLVRNSRSLTVLSLVTSAVIMMAGAIAAGEWHVGPSLQCGACHVEHGIAGGDPIPGGPYSTLLKKSTINGLCLTCHDGSDPTAPDVLAPVTMYSQTTSLESSAGHLITSGTVNPYGHTLDVASTTPLSSAGRTFTLNCASCHDYHGNANYRNLRYDPAGVGDSIVIVLGEDLFEGVAPADPPTAGGSAAAYERGNIGYKSGWSSWCATCHDQLGTNGPASPPAHFSGHPAEMSIGAVGGDAHADVAHWLSGTGEGFAGNTQVAGEGVPRLPFLQPSASDFAGSRSVQNSNRLSCITCHAPHGTSNAKAMRWPYVEGGINYISGCQQCHHK